MDASTEPFNSLDCRANPPVHAAAGVEQYTDADRHVLVLAEMGDLLRFSILFDNEIVCRKTRNQSAASIADGCNDVDQTDIDSNLRCHDCCDRDDRDQDES